MAGGWSGREAGGVLGDLGGGLLLRRAKPADAEAIASFNARVHHSPGGPFERREPHAGVAATTRDLISGDHPACRPEDFTVVEDTGTGSVISSACLIEQRFYYGGVELRAGLPEMVGTHPDYRRRGLVGEQMAMLHAWGRERGHLMQAIAGIPYFYRRFGYEMAVWMGLGRRLFARDLPDEPGQDRLSTISVRRRLLTPLSSLTWNSVPSDAICWPLPAMRPTGVTKWPAATPRATSSWW